MMVLNTFEKVTAELETALFPMEKSYVLGFCKDDVHYDDFGQPWVDYSDMHDYSVQIFNRRIENRLVRMSTS
jgi:hypothetical protein